MSKETIAVWFSCGAASAVAAKKTIEAYSDTCNVRIVNNPIKEEHPDNRRFLVDVEQWLGVEIESAINPKWPNCSVVEVWDARRAMSFPKGAPCTQELKKKARQHWERINDCHAMVLGFTAEEQDRHTDLASKEILPIIPVLINLGITKLQCFNILHEAGIRLPAMYLDGFTNANCIGCSKATSPEYWNLVRKKYPEVFKQRAEQSKRLGVNLVRVKNKRIQLNELNPVSRGRRIKPIEPYQCSLFC